MSFTSSVADFFDTIARARAAHAIYSDLSHLSDAELARRGISRDQISRKALEAL